MGNPSRAPLSCCNTLDLTPSRCKAKELEQFTECMRGIFSLVDVDTSGHLTMVELQEIFEDPQLRRVLEAFEINCALPFDIIWPIIDVNGDGSISFEEFLEGNIELVFWFRACLVASSLSCVF